MYEENEVLQKKSRIFFRLSSPLFSSPLVEKPRDGIGQTMEALLKGMAQYG